MRVFMGGSLGSDDGVVHGHQLGAVGESGFDLDVRNHFGDSVHNVGAGEHYHFFETNTALGFDRDAARGYRLDIAAGTAVRFEPGQTRTVQLVALGGERKVYGFRGLIQGAL